MTMTTKKTALTAALAILLALALLSSAALAAGSEGDPFALVGAAVSDGDMLSYLSDAIYAATGVRAQSPEDLAALLDSADTAQAARELRSLLDLTRWMSDSELRTQIEALARSYGVALTDAELDAIVSACRDLEPLSEAELQAKLDSLCATVSAALETGSRVSSFGGSVRDILQRLAELVQGLFS